MTFRRWCAALPAGPAAVRRAAARRGAVRRGAVRLGVLVAGLALAASACSTSDPTGSGAPASTRAGSTGQGSGDDKPRFASDFERTCTDGIGFPGAAAYTKGAKGVHPAIHMTKDTTKNWVDSQPSDWPKNWTLGYPADVSKAQLVVCYERTNAVSSGKTCQMEDNKTKEPFTMTMYNTQYRLQVLESRTGKVVYDKRGTAKSTDCPTLTFVGGDDDRTKYYTDLRPTDYRGLVKPYIAP